MECRLEDKGAGTRISHHDTAAMPSLSQETTMQPTRVVITPRRAHIPRLKPTLAHALAQLTTAASRMGRSRRISQVSLEIAKTRTSLANPVLTEAGALTAAVEGILASPVRKTRSSLTIIWRTTLSYILNLSDSMSVSDLIMAFPTAPNKGIEWL
jgi:hypothetical protein